MKLSRWLMSIIATCIIFIIQIILILKLVKIFDKNDIYIIYGVTISLTFIIVSLVLLVLIWMIKSFKNKK